MGQDIRKTASDILEAIDILESIDKSWKTLTDEQIEKLKNKNSNIIKDLEKRQNRLILLYNGKFGHPMTVRKKPVRNEAEAAQMLHYLYDNDVNNLLFAESQGVLGRLFVKKAAATDYNQYYETAELIKDYCRYTTSLLEKYVNAKGLIEQLQCDYIKTFADIKNINGDNCKDALYIGDIEEPVESSYSLKKLEEAGYLENLWLKIPFSYNLKSPFVLLIKNSAEDAQEKNAAYIRNIMYRVMCSQPMYSYTFTYYDQSGGRNIGNLNMLSDVINYNAYFLNERLFNHRFQQLELYTTKQEISESLSRFEEYIAGINKVCSDYPNVASYNKACNDGVIATGNIPNRYVFFENICGATDDVERIRKIIENSMRCGISLVICADLSEKSNNASTVEQIKNIPGVDVIEIENEGSSFKYNQVNISGEGTRKEEFIYQYDPCYLEAVDSEFISGFSKALNPDVKLETRFEKLFDDSSWWQKCGDVEIQFPVAVDMQGKLQDLILGNPSYPFGMMCGHAGCGKSSFLHTIINGVIKNYHPLDVQLWLIDYNMVEFAQYIDNTPPHVRFIGLSKSKEYTLSLIDKIYNEYHRRFEIYENSRIASVADYRKLNGEHSWPRMLAKAGCDKVIQKLDDMASEMFLLDGTKASRVYTHADTLAYCSASDTAPVLNDAIERFKDANPSVQIVSESNNRVFFLKITTCVPMFAYGLIDEMYAAYQEAKSVTGKHLYEGAAENGDPRNWQTDLPDLRPYSIYKDIDWTTPEKVATAAAYKTAEYEAGIIHSEIDSTGNETGHYYIWRTPDYMPKLMSAKELADKAQALVENEKSTLEDCQNILKKFNEVQSNLKSYKEELIDYTLTYINGELTKPEIPPISIRNDGDKSTDATAFDVRRDYVLASPILMNVVKEELGKVNKYNEVMAQLTEVTAAVSAKLSRIEHRI